MRGAETAMLLLVTLVVPAVAPGESAGGDLPKAAGAALGPASTPFTSTRAGEIVVPVAIGGRGPFRFLLDTGSTHTAVTGRLAAAVGGVPVARTVMRAAAGAVDCIVVGLPPLTVGAATAAGITATVLPAAAASVLNSSLDGVLGQDFLARFDFTIDYSRSRVEWHEAGYAASGIQLALVPARDRWLVELPQATPQRLHRFVPDSGADTIVLFDEARARCLVAEWHAGAAALNALTGARAVRTATIVALRIGDTFLDRQTAAVVPASSPDGADGLLPLHLFARVFFSARSRALVVEPR